MREKQSVPLQFVELLSKELKIHGPPKRCSYCTLNVLKPATEQLPDHLIEYFSFESNITHR